MKELRALVSGTVQMVMYRSFVNECAQELDLSGFVRNLSTGDVEVVVQGDEVTIEKFLARIRVGPPLARVVKVETEWRESQNAFDSFRVEY